MENPIRRPAAGSGASALCQRSRHRTTFDGRGPRYFGEFRNAPPRIIGTARLAIGIYAFICVIHAVRARIEGIAAARKRPRAVMWGQIAYTTSLFAVCAALLPLGCPGWAIAVSATFVAPVCVTAAVYAALAVDRRRQGVIGGRGRPIVRGSAIEPRGSLRREPLNPAPRASPPSRRKPRQLCRGCPSSGLRRQ